MAASSICSSTLAIFSISNMLFRFKVLLLVSICSLCFSETSKFLVNCFTFSRSLSNFTFSVLISIFLAAKSAFKSPYIYNHFFALIPKVHVLLLSHLKSLASAERISSLYKKPRLESHPYTGGNKRCFHENFYVFKMYGSL